MEGREGDFNFEESYGFKALHFEDYEPQMNADERRFIATGNTDDADLADLHGKEIRVRSQAPSFYNYIIINFSAPICSKSSHITLKTAQHRQRTQYELLLQENPCLEGKGGQSAATKSLSISSVNNKTYGIFEQHRFED